MRQTTATQKAPTMVRTRFDGHSPGPWSAPSAGIYSAHGVLIAETGSRDVTRSMRKAGALAQGPVNGALIAAGPDLVMHVIALLRALSDIIDEGTYDHDGAFVIPAGSWDGTGDPPDTSDPDCLVGAQEAMKAAKEFLGIEAAPQTAANSSERTNADRAETAARVLDAYRGQKSHGAAEPEDVQDLLSDLRHLCDRDELDFADLDRRAHDNYSAEVVEERNARKAA